MTLDRSPSSDVDERLVERRLLNRELSWLRVQRAGARPGRRAGHPAARTGQVLRHRLDQPRRVLPGARRRAEGPGRRRHRRRPSPTVSRPAQQLHGDRSTVVARLVARQEESSSTSCCPSCAADGIEIARLGRPRARPSGTSCVEIFEQRIFPVLTPLAVDPAHPFPYISNLALSLAAMVGDPDTGERRFARVKVPTVFPRLIALAGRQRFVPGRTGHRRAPAISCSRAWWSRSARSFRVTRNADLTLEDEDADDLLAAVELELRRRRFGRAVRLEVAGRHERRDARAARARARPRARRRLRPRGAARPHLPVAAARARPARAEGRRRGRRSPPVASPPPRKPSAASSRSSASGRAGAPPVRELRQQRRERSSSRRPTTRRCSRSR